MRETIANCTFTIGRVIRFVDGFVVAGNSILRMKPALLQNADKRSYRIILKPLTGIIKED